MAGWCEGREVSEGCFVNFPGIQINTGCLLKGDRYLFIYLFSCKVYKQGVNTFTTFTTAGG